MNLTKEIELLMFITSKHISVEQDDINVKTKYKEQVMARMVICNILMECGMKPAELAKHFCKHRTNYYHYLKLHKQYIQNPRMYPEYIEAFDIVFAEYKTKSERIEKINELQALDEVDRAIADLIQIRKALA
tara:strand:- start:564 stop:959 length:396 start_codon:yes stop_codon:yes gene_type:complete